MGLLTGRELDDVEMHVTRIKPEGLDVLCRDTKFTRKELQIMYRGFKQVRASLQWRQSKFIWGRAIEGPKAP